MLLENLVILGSFAFHMFFCAVLVRWISKRKSPAFQGFENPKRRNWEMKVTSSFHAIIVTIIGVSVVIHVAKYYEIEDFTKWSSVIGRVNIAWSIGYMLQDFVWMVIYRKQVDSGAGAYIHHFIAGLAFYLCLYFQVVLFYANFRIISELSTPFVNFRWILSASGKKESRIYMYNGLAMTFAFFLSRIVTIPIFWYSISKVMKTASYWQSFNTFKNLTWLTFCVLLDALNIYWMYKIFQGALSFLKPANRVQLIPPDDDEDNSVARGNKDDEIRISIDDAFSIEQSRPLLQNGTSGRKLL